MKDYSKVKYVKPSVDGLDITKGKVYELMEKQGIGVNCYNILDDVSHKIIICLHSCMFLSRMPWIPCDENGTEIYEGDIISGDDYPFIDEGKQNYVGVVEWMFAGFQYVLKCVNPEKRGISDGVNDIIEDSGWIEVIGNIHQESEFNND